MAYDPNFPVANTPATSAEMRGQLNGLKELIDAVPAGPPGPPGADGAAGAPGPQGPPFASAVVDGVNTLDPGNPAQVTVSFDASLCALALPFPAARRATRASKGRSLAGRPWMA